MTPPPNSQGLDARPVPVPPLPAEAVPGKRTTKPRTRKPTPPVRATSAELVELVKLMRTKGLTDDETAAAFKSAEEVTGTAVKHWDEVPRTIVQGVILSLKGRPGPADSDFVQPLEQSADVVGRQPGREIVQEVERRVFSTQVYREPKEHREHKGERPASTPPASRGVVDPGVGDLGRVLEESTAAAREWWDGDRPEWASLMLVWVREVRRRLPTEGQQDPSAAWDSIRRAAEILATQGPTPLELAADLGPLSGFLPLAECDDFEAESDVESSFFTWWRKTLITGNNPLEEAAAAWRAGRRVLVLPEKLSRQRHPPYATTLGVLLELGELLHRLNAGRAPVPPEGVRAIIPVRTLAQAVGSMSLGTAANYISDAVADQFIRLASRTRHVEGRKMAAEYLIDIHRLRSMVAVRGGV